MRAAAPDRNRVRVPVTVYFSHRNGADEEVAVPDVSEWLRTLPLKKLKKLESLEWDCDAITKSLGYWLARRGNEGCREALNAGLRCVGALFDDESEAERWFANFASVPRRKRSESREQVKLRMKRAWATRKDYVPYVAASKDYYGEYYEQALAVSERLNGYEPAKVDKLVATKKQRTMSERAKLAWEKRRADIEARKKYLAEKRAALEKQRAERAAAARAAKAELFRAKFSGVIQLRRPKLILEDPIEG